MGLSQSNQRSEPNPPVSISPITGVLANLFGVGTRIQGGGIDLSASRGDQNQFANRAFGTDVFQDIPGLAQTIQLGLPFEAAGAFGDLAEGRGVDAFNLFDESILPGAAELAETGFRTDIQPIVDRETRRFERETIPGIADRFAGLTGGFSSDFLNATTQAGANLSANLGGLQVGLDEAAASRRTQGLPIAAQLGAVSAGLPTALGSDLLTFEQQRRAVEQSGFPGASQLALLQQLAGIVPTSGIPQSPTSTGRSNSAGKGGGGGLPSTAAATPAAATGTAAFAPLGAQFGLAQGATAGIGAAGLGNILTTFSSRAFKHNGQPINEEHILRQLDDLAIERWTYNQGIDDSGQHIGPYAEDFAEAFGVGNGRSIHMADALGVALAAIKQLSREVRELKAGVQK